MPKSPAETADALRLLLNTPAGETAVALLARGLLNPTTGAVAAYINAAGILVGPTGTPLLGGTSAADITDASANGRSLLTAADYAAMRTLLGAVTQQVVRIESVTAITTSTTLVDTTLSLSLVPGSWDIEFLSIVTPASIVADGAIQQLVFDANSSGGGSSNPPIMREQILHQANTASWAGGTFPNALKFEGPVGITSCSNGSLTYGTIMRARFSVLITATGNIKIQARSFAGTQISHQTGSFILARRYG